MRYYVIINGINSLTIPGLAIKDLPPISKTLMRNQKETIDGRDGDIITELGYSAYDKALTIGLYGSYDINDIIAFFNQKGTIVFSDEPDKYYNFTILDQIDYDKLVKFRTATIRIHCQPFKYPVTETPVEIEAEYVTAQAEEMTLNDTGVAPLEIGLKGNTYQASEPTPDNPVEVQVVTGDNTIKVCGINLWDEETILGYYNDNGVWQTRSDILSSKNPIYVNPSESYYFKAPSQAYYTQWTSNGTFISRTNIPQGYGTLTLNSNCAYILFNLLAGYGTTYNHDIMISYGTTATPYTPHQEQEYEINLGKNLINLTNSEAGGIDSSGAEISATGNWRGTEYILVSPNTKYTMSLNTSSLFRIYEYDENKNFISPRIETTGESKTITTTSNTKYLRWTVYKAGGIDLSYVQGLELQLEKGNATTYSPYFTPIELCKIGTYQDYIYKSGENWYKKAYIGKVVLNGSESWTGYTDLGTNARAYFAKNGIALRSAGYCSHFNAITTQTWNTDETGIMFTPVSVSLIGIKIPENKLATQNTDGIKNWLSTNNVTAYYILEVPIEEQITNAELIEQLNAILNAVSYEDQTNISQENDNLPFILDVSTLKKGSNEAIIDNDGNIYSKPIINIVGDGIVGVSLNGSQILSLDMTTYNDITIDTETMEAYDPNTSQLRNRQVTGNYNNLRLQPGENTISLNGGFTSATISKYKRWL